MVGPPVSIVCMSTWHLGFTVFKLITVTSLRSPAQKRQVCMTHADNSLSCHSCQVSH